MKHIITLLSLLIVNQTIVSFALANPQDMDYYSNRILKSTIHTVQIHPKGWEMGYPIIQLGGKTQLELSFDDFDTQSQDYSYRLVHCDANWMISGLSEMDYLEGFSENPVQDYELSFNTNIRYTHYSITFPNSEVQPKLSGNYLLVVYEDFDPEKVVLSQRFMIVEPLVNIRGNVKPPINLDLRETHQEIDFSILHKDFTIDNPQMDLKVFLTQNNRWDASLRKLNPLFIRPHELVYDYDRENVFAGGNEFRFFDMKSLRYQTHNIKNIQKKDNQYLVELFPDINRHFKPYIYQQEINGQYVISVQERNDPCTEADYAWVRFTLPMKAPMINGKFYVYGKLSQWECLPSHAMKYDIIHKEYQLDLLLKQGYYNYQYAFLEKGKKLPDLTLTEGSHRETENDYLIYVYYHDIAKNYDRLIGWKALNSLQTK